MKQERFNISSIKKYDKLFLLFGAVIFIGYLIFTNPFSVLFQVGRFNPWIFFFAVILNWTGLIFLSGSWHVLLKVLGVKINIWRSIQITLISMFVVWIFPIPSGVEIVRAYLIKDMDGSSMGKAVSSVIVSKVYYFISFGVLITLAAIIVTIISGGGFPVNPDYVWFIVIYALANTIAATVLLNPKLLTKIYENSPVWAKKNIFERIFAPNKRLGTFHSFVEDLNDAIINLKRKPWDNLISLLMVGFQWSTGSLTAWLIANSLQTSISFWVIVLIFAVIEFIQQLNIVIPGGLGIVDAGLTGAFVVIGIPLSTASAISLLTRLATYWFELVLAAVVGFIFGYTNTLKDILPY